MQDIPSVNRAVDAVRCLYLAKVAEQKGHQGATLGWQETVNLEFLGRAGNRRFPGTPEFRLIGGRKSTNLVFATPDRLRSVVIDPGAACPDVDVSNNRWPNQLSSSENKYLQLTSE
jgi:hypothetical protein